MSSTRDLRRRIKSIKNTSQITKAMEMVSSIKMRKATQNALDSRPYQLQLRQVLTKITRGESLTHPLMSSNDSNVEAILFLTTDKSLCGALNTNLFKALQSENSNVIYYCVGKKGASFVAKTAKQLEAEFKNLEIVSLSEVTQIRKTIVSDFLAGKFSKLSIIFPHFKSILVQSPIKHTILPINPDTLKQFLADNTEDSSAEYKIEPDITRVLDFALTHYLDVAVQSALLELKASEHSARMIAMQNASNNAADLVSDLTLSYNQIRQESITRELLEITSALAAMN